MACNNSLCSPTANLNKVVVYRKGSVGRSEELFIKWSVPSATFEITA